MLASKTSAGLSRGKNNGDNTVGPLETRRQGGGENCKVSPDLGTYL